MHPTPPVDSLDTGKYRDHLGLVKDRKDKSKQIPETHANDAIAIAATAFMNYKAFNTANTHGHEWVGKVSITPSLFKVISKPRITRRRLFDAVPC